MLFILIGNFWDSSNSTSKGAAIVQKKLLLLSLFRCTFSDQFLVSFFFCFLFIFGLSPCSGSFQTPLFIFWKGEREREREREKGGKEKTMNSFVWVWVVREFVVTDRNIQVFLDLIAFGLFLFYLNGFYFHSYSFSFLSPPPLPPSFSSLFLYFFPLLWSF